MSGDIIEIRSYILATISMWSEGSGVLDDAFKNRIANVFPFDELQKARAVFNDEMSKHSLSEEIKIPTVHNKDSVKLAGNIIEQMKKLKNKKECDFLVQSKDLGKVPGVSPAAVSPVDAKDVNARLTALESQLAKVLQGQISLQQAVNTGLSKMSTKNPPSAPSLSVPTVQNIPGIVPNHGRGRTASFASNIGTPTRTASQKRSRQEDAVGENQPAAGAAGVAGGLEKETWAKVASKKKKRTPPTRGTSKVETRGVVVAPFDLYIGNTHHTTTADVIKDTLKEVAAQAPDDIKPDNFDVIEAEPLTKEIDGVAMFRRSWRVRVAWKYREYIVKPDALPYGWTSRRYFPPRPKRSESDAVPAAKRPFQPSMSSGGASSPLVQ